MFTPLQNLLPKEFNRRGITEAATGAVVCKNFRELMADLFPKEAAEFINAKYFKNKTLTLHVADGSWAKAVLDRKSDIIKAMNAKMGSQIISDLKAKVGVPDDQEDPETPAPEY